MAAKVVRHHPLVRMLRRAATMAANATTSRQPACPKWATAFVLAVGISAPVVSGVLAERRDVDRGDLTILVFLLTAALAASELAGRRDRRQSRFASPGQTNPVWCIAATMLPTLVTPVFVIALYGHGWFRQRRAAAATESSRPVFDACIALLAIHAATAAGRTMDGAGLSGAGDGAYPVPVVLAGITYAVVHTGLVLTAATLQHGPSAARHMLRAAHGNDQGAAIALGIVAAAVVQTWPALVLLAVPVVLALHRVQLVVPLEHAAATDGKTGLYNDTAWRARASELLSLAASEGRCVAVLMIDLDHFKWINDRYGHLAGDDVLRAVAGVLRRAVEPNGLVGRFGGEEFVVLLPNVTGIGEALSVGEDIRAGVGGLRLRVRRASGDVVMRVTASIGVALYPEAGPGLAELLLAADDAVFVAKYRGRDQVCKSAGQVDAADLEAA